MVFYPQTCVVKFKQVITSTAPTSEPSSVIALKILVIIASHSWRHSQDHMASGDADIYIQVFWNLSLLPVTTTQVPSNVWEKALIGQWMMWEVFYHVTQCNNSRIYRYLTSVDLNREDGSEKAVLMIQVFTFIW